MYETEKDIPIPQVLKGGPPKKYDFHLMEIGNSKFSPHKSMLQSAISHGNRVGWKFTTRKVEGGWRVWRIA